MTSHSFLARSTFCLLLTLLISFVDAEAQSQPASPNRQPSVGETYRNNIDAALANVLKSGGPASMAFSFDPLRHAIETCDVQKLTDDEFVTTQGLQKSTDPNHFTGNTQNDGLSFFRVIRQGKLTEANLSWNTVTELKMPSEVLAAIVAKSRSVELLETPTTLRVMLKYEVAAKCSFSQSLMINLDGRIVGVVVTGRFL